MHTNDNLRAGVSLPLPTHARDPLPGGATVQVWDLPVRVFHVLLIACVLGAYLSGDSEHWRLWHVNLGYAMSGLVAFRILWGFAGSRYARFGSFVRGPAAVLRYLRSLAARQPEHHTGHNPAGAVAILGLLALAALTGLSGWAAYNEIGGERLKEAHEVVANAMMTLVGIHVLGVIVGSWLHRENLVLAMITGRKRSAAACAADGAARAHPAR
jgi:cytochrome b